MKIAQLLLGKVFGKTSWYASFESPFAENNPVIEFDEISNPYPAKKFTRTQLVALRDHINTILKNYDEYSSQLSELND